MDVNGATSIVTNANPTTRNPDTASSKEVKEFKETKEAIDRSTTSNNSSKQSQGTSNSYPLFLATRPPINPASSTGNQGAPSRSQPSSTYLKQGAANPSPSTTASGDVVATARTELGRNAHDVKLGSDAIGKAMSDDVSDWNNCANFVGGSLVAAGQITSKDMSANVDGLMDKLRKTGNYTESNSLADVQKGDVVAFNHAHVMICTGFDANGKPTFIGSNNDNKDRSQKISEGPLTKWFKPNSEMLKAWESNVVIMHRNEMEA